MNTPILESYKDEIIEKYNLGLAMRDIADCYGVSDDTVRKYLHKWNVTKARSMGDRTVTEDQIVKTPTHKHEKVIDTETGKKYYDITDYFIDCGSGV